MLYQAVLLLLSTISTHVKLSMKVTCILKWACTSEFRLPRYIQGDP